MPVRLALSNLHTVLVTISIHNQKASYRYLYEALKNTPPKQSETNMNKNLLTPTYHHRTES
jgi:hypothetical protein